MRRASLLYFRSKSLFAVLFAGRCTATTPGGTDTETRWRRATALLEREVEYFSGCLLWGILTYAIDCRVGAPPNPACRLLGTDRGLTYYMLPGHRGCFRATVAQAMMLQIGYGADISGFEWKAFERLAAKYAQLVAQALQHVPALDDGLAHLRGALARFLNETLPTHSEWCFTAVRKRADVQRGGYKLLYLPDPDLEIAEVPTRILARKVGVFHRVPTSSVPGHVECHYIRGAMPRTVLTSLRGSKAFVLMAADQSPFADAILVFPGHSIFLLQAKNHVKTKLSETDAVDELFKLGFEPVFAGERAAAKAAVSAQLNSDFPAADVRFAGDAAPVRVYMRGGNYRVNPRPAGADGYHILVSLMQDFCCPVAFPVFVTRERADATAGSRIVGCRCPCPPGVRNHLGVMPADTVHQDVPVLWWTAEDLHPFSGLLALDQGPTTAAEVPTRKRTRR